MLQCWMRRQISVILACFAAVVLFSHAVSSADLPQGVVNTQDAADVSLTPRESLGRITAPPGFQVTLFAGEPNIRRPIAFDFDDRGRLWVVENYSHPKVINSQNPDRILILEDTDNDGQFDRRKVFWSGGRYLTAIAYGHGGVWVGNTPELSFIPDRDGDDVPDSEPIVVLDGFAESTNNVLNNFHWGPDGWLYGAIGLKQMSYVGKPGTPRTDRVAIPRGIWRMHPVSHKFEVQAVGMVNPWGADFNEYGDLITTNTVISHLWHVVPGMYLQRRGKEQDYPFAYGRIQSINDHLHWGGGKWTDSRQSSDGVTSHQHSVAGGGHAHCGGMVYLGDNWPAKYRGKFFTCNLHGNRVNMDHLVPNKSTYIGTHGADFLMANDPWFRGLTIKYGPDGGVFISDWHDFGECHDADGSHRTSGRIYKVVYGGPPELDSFDLATLPATELFALQKHKNAWFRRHARRILHERWANAQPPAVREIEGAVPDWRTAVAEIDIDDHDALSMYWAINVVGGLNEEALCELGRSSNDHLKRWAVRSISELENPSEDALRLIAELAKDPSAKVRLAVAVALQRIPEESRWAIARELVRNAHDTEDPYLPLMTWYGVEPMVVRDVPRALRLANASRIPLLRQFIVRRILDVNSPPIETVLSQVPGLPDELSRLDYLLGVREALSDRGRVVPPSNWSKISERASKGPNSELRSVATDLAGIFGDAKAIDDLRRSVANKAANVTDRKTALKALLKLDGIVTANMLHDLAMNSSLLRDDALEALAIQNNRQTPSVLLQLFPELTNVQRQAACSVLVTRAAFALQLLDAIDSGVVSRGDVSAYALQHLRSYRDAEIQSAAAVVWPTDSAEASKADELARYKQKLTPEYLAGGDASAGRKIYADNCAKCHSLFGTGGNVGPDLTGSGRANLDYVLSNLIDPNALVDEAYRLTTVEMTDGRLLTGFIQRHGEGSLVLRTQDSEVTLRLQEIDDLQTTDRSMMPEGLLQSFRDAQIRDLVVYLRSTDQVDLPLPD